jgi:hypothetical protein
MEYDHEDDDSGGGNSDVLVSDINMMQPDTIAP